MWQTIYNWPWATIWSAISAIFTAAAVGVAAWAIFRWKKQDELRVKLDFKKSVTQYAYALTHTSKTQKDELRSLYGKCTFDWMACEGLLKSNEVVFENWKGLVKKHMDYMDGEPVAKELMLHCTAIMDAKFVFN